MKRNDSPDELNSPYSIAKSFQDYAQRNALSLPSTSVVALFKSFARVKFGIKSTKREGRKSDPSVEKKVKGSKIGIGDGLWTNVYSQLVQSKKKKGKKYLLLNYVPNTKYFIAIHLESCTMCLSSTDETYTIELTDLEIDIDLSSQRKFLEIGRDIGGIEKIFIKFLNQSFFSQWTFLFKRNGVRFQKQIEQEQDITESNENDNDSDNVLDMLKKIDPELAKEMQKKKLQHKKTTQSKKKKGFFTASIVNLVSSNDDLSWQNKHYSNWSNSDFTEYTKNIYFTKHITFFDILSKSSKRNFSSHEISGDLLSKIGSLEDINDVFPQLNLPHKLDLMEELKELKENNGFFDTNKLDVLEKHIKVAEQGTYHYTIEEMKLKMKYTWHRKTLREKIIKILFNIHDDMDEKMFIKKFEMIMEDPSIEFFKFQVKVLAIDMMQNTNLLTRLGMKILANKVDTFFHLGLIIKNMRLDWYSNELVRISKFESKKPIMNVDIDCICLEKKDFECFLKDLMDEIIHWNSKVRYQSYTSKKNTKKIDGLQDRSFKDGNCHFFVERMMSVYNQEFKYPSAVLNYFEKMKKEKKIRMEFEFGPDFEKDFLLNTNLFTRTEKMDLPFKEVSNSGFSSEETNKSIIIYSHSFLDTFVQFLQNTHDLKLWIEYFDYYELLKGFDRAFHCRYEYAKKNAEKWKNKENLEVVLKQAKCSKKYGCPFNHKADLESFVEKYGEDQMIIEEKKETEIKIEKKEKKEKEKNEKDDCTIL